MRRSAVVAAALMTALWLTVSVSTQGGADRRRPTIVVDGREAVAGDVLVKFRDSRSNQARGPLKQQIDADEDEGVGGLGIRRLHSRMREADALLAFLRSQPDVEYAEPNYLLYATILPNDAQFPSLWGLLNTGQNVFGSGTAGADIGAASAWNVSTGSRANVVAVVDTGVDYTHPDLASNIWSAPGAFTVSIGGQTIGCAAGTHGFNAITRTCDPMDDHNHGTHVAGTIGAIGNNGAGVAGVNWTASIMATKFLNAGGSGFTSDAVNAIEFAIQAKTAFAAGGGANVRVLSSSWGGGGFSQTLLDEINKADSNNMLFVAAAGNSAQNTDVAPFYPASYAAPNVMAVAATDNNDRLASFSSYGRSTVHLGAPGVNVLSTTRNNSYAYFSGTSMATPHVSGAAALVLSRCPIGAASLKSALLNTVDPIASLSTRSISGGRLNVGNAIQACMPASVPAGMTSPNPGTMLPGSSATFNWTGGSGVSQIWLDVGTTTGGSQIYAGSQGVSLSRIVTGLPTNGSTVDVRLWSLTSSGWGFTDYTYAALMPVPAGMLSPVPGVTLAGAAAMFTWTPGTAVSQIWLDVGTAPGGSQIYAGTQGLSLSRTVTGLPTNGSTVYVRLWSLTSLGWGYTDYSYAAVMPVPAGLLSPAPGATLPGGTATFRWTSGTAVSQIWLDVGTTPGGSEVYAGSQAVALSRTVAGLPTDGSTIYVRLWSLTSLGWGFTDYSYAISI